MFKVYLAGPISGLTYEEASLGWRVQFERLLAPPANGTLLKGAFSCYSPMRAKDFLAGEGTLEGAYAHNPMSSEKGILGRDRNDVRTCDLMIACFLEAQDNLSLGTAMEFGWADAWRKPVIMVAEDGNFHRKHPMLSAASVYTVDNLEEAAHLTRHLLLPGI